MSYTPLRQMGSCGQFRRHSKADLFRAWKSLRLLIIPNIQIHLLTYLLTYHDVSPAGNNGSFYDRALHHVCVNARSYTFLVIPTGLIHLRLSMLVFTLKRLDRLSAAAGTGNERGRLSVTPARDLIPKSRKYSKSTQQKRRYGFLSLKIKLSRRSSCGLCGAARSASIF